MNWIVASFPDNVYYSSVIEELEIYEWEKIDYLASMCWPCFGLGEDQMWVFEDNDDDRVFYGPRGRGGL